MNRRGVPYGLSILIALAVCTPGAPAQTTGTVYSAKYGVLVNLGQASGGTAVMRPDFSQVKWE